jgi:hypothetical protein
MHLPRAVRRGMSRARRLTGDREEVRVEIDKTF